MSDNGPSQKDFGCVCPCAKEEFSSLFSPPGFPQGHETVIMVTDILWEGIKFRFLRRKIFFLFSMCLFLVPWQRLSLSFILWAALALQMVAAFPLVLSTYQRPDAISAFHLARLGICFVCMFSMFPCDLQHLQICTKVSQSILSALERTSEIQTSIFTCRTIIYATTVPKLLYDQVKLVCDDCKSGYVKRSCRIPIPQSLLEWQGGGSLILLWLLIASWNCAHCILFLLGHDIP